MEKDSMLPYSVGVSREIVRRAQSIKEKVIPEMKEAERKGLIHYTTDLGQKEHSKHSFITVTAHWIDANYEMKSQVLGTMDFAEAVGGTYNTTVLSSEDEEEDSSSH